MKNSLTTIVLAAGKGTRMQSAKPKVLQTLANKPLLAHVLDTCQSINVDKTIVVYGFGGNQVKSAMSDYPLTWVEQAEQLGTGHAVKVALNELPNEGKSLILYGDVPLVTAKTLTKLKEANQDGVSMLTLTVSDPFGLGRIKRNSQGNIIAIVEQKDASEEEQAIHEINSGIYCVDNTLLHKYLPNLSNDNAQKEYYLTDIVKMAVADGIAITAIEPEHEFEIEGVNNRQQLSELERRFQAKLVADLQIQGVHFADPNRVDIRGSITVGRDVFVDINVIFEGRVTLGNNVTIQAGCVIKNSTLADNVSVKPNCVIDEAIIGNDVSIGPFAHLRPGTIVDDKARLGNFVEIKKSQVGKGSKVNHLSYIGDAQIGAGVNVGAGVITCNYDGINKYKTTIGDNSFIGTNSCLVAPLTIGHTVTIGAGSVITKDVEDKALAIARGRQVQKDNYQRPEKKK